MGSSGRGRRGVWGRRSGGGVVGFMSFGGRYLGGMGMGGEGGRGGISGLEKGFWV